jgi:hypothetical protein
MRTPVGGATVANALTPSNEGTKCHVLVGGKLVSAPNTWIVPHSPPGLPLRGRHGVVPGPAAVGAPTGARHSTRLRGCVRPRVQHSKMPIGPNLLLGGTNQPGGNCFPLSKG